MNSGAGCPTWKGGITAPKACNSPSYQTCTYKWGAEWQNSTGRATPQSQATHSPSLPTRTRNTMCHLAGSAWNGGIALPAQPWLQVKRAQAMQGCRVAAFTRQAGLPSPVSPSGRLRRRCAAAGVTWKGGITTPDEP